LGTTATYLVSVIDENKFKLSEGTTLQNVNYVNKNFIKLRSLGTGTHRFAYPPIQIIINNTNPNIIEPILEPVVLGEIDSIFIKSGGVKYGSPDIINYHRRPEIKISEITSECVLKPLISNGKIIDVIILNKGRI